MISLNSLLVINLGCEMLYIIDQRLTAQTIAKDKSAQGMFNHYLTICVIQIIF